MGCRMSEASQRRLNLGMLLMAVCISTWDKLIFAFAGPSIIRDLALTPVQFGFAGSAFFLPYCVFGLLMGFAANRFQTRWILLGMSLIWVVAQGIVTWADNLAALVVGRMLLGAGTGPTTAVAQHAGFKWFRAPQRLIVSSLHHVALVGAGLLAVVALPLLMQQQGWRFTYLMLAVLSGAWMLGWLCVGREGATDTALPHAFCRQKNYRQLLLNRTFISVTVVGMVGYVPHAIGFSWLMVFLQQGVGLAPAHIAAYMVTVTALMLVASLVALGLSQRALKRGASMRSTMVVPPMLACCIGGVAFFGMTIAPTHTAFKLTLYAIGCLGLSLLPQYAFAVVSHISGTVQRGASLAIHNAIVTSAGLVVPMLIGLLVQAADGDVAQGLEVFFSAFGLVALAAALTGLWFIQPESHATPLTAPGYT
jgi:MFS family permease